MITLTRALSFGAVLVLAGCAAETIDTSGEEEAIASKTAALTSTGGAPHTAPTPPTSGYPSQSHNGYSCHCVETRRSGTDYIVPSCSNAEDRCADVGVLVACEDDPDGAGCDYPLSCECDCTAVDETTEFEHGPYDDILLTGVPDLWQFNFMCGSNGVSANAVGCGPVATAMVLYHWAQQGYEGLVDDFLLGAGSGPTEQEHDWQSLVRELRANYLNGGICVPFGGGQYAVTMGKMITGITEYIEDAGYDAEVRKYKVCRNCIASASDEMTSGAGLELIKDELEAGRPLIMGFNAGRAFDTQGAGWDGFTWEQYYTGELSNGTPVAGTIDHYAVITGYRRIAGVDVLTLNVGYYDDITDHQVMWNPAGKWLHLYTIDINSRPDGDEWCSIDRGVDENRSPPTADAFTQPYIEISHVERSSQRYDNELTVLAGTSCGIARSGSYSTYYDTTHQSETCPTRLPDHNPGDIRPHQDPTPGGHDNDVSHDNGPPILDELEPLP